MDNEQIDFTKLKYVLYARKSTVDKERQVRSVQDQISDCKAMASFTGLNIKKIYQESRSAKKPGIRPIYSQMIKEIKKGLYDGIIAWNPDRLARNMLEGGEIINLIDEGIIKDLKFKTHYFTHDANGKMLLGMAFVLSKQYSDDLSQKVTRGVKNNFQDGKTPTPKQGYRNENGQYPPDGNNHELMKKAWKMRVANNPIKYISKVINDDGHFRLLKKKRTKIFMTKQKLSDVFKDSFYYGKIVQAGKVVDLKA